MIKARKKWKKTRKVHWGCFPLNNSLVKILRSIVVLKSLTSLIIEVSYLCSYIPPYPSRWLSKRIDHINILSKFFPSRPGELSVFPLNFPHKFNISDICQAVFEFCQNWKHFQRGRKTNRLLEGSLLNELLPTPLKDRGFCRISHNLKKNASRIFFQLRKFPYSQIEKGGSVVSTTERKNTCLRRIESWRKRDCPGKRSLRRWAILPRDSGGPNLQSNFLQISEEILFRLYPEIQS